MERATLSRRAGLRGIVVAVSLVTGGGCRPPPPNEDEIAAAESHARDTREALHLMVVPAPYVPRPEPKGRTLTVAERDRGIDKLIEGREALSAKRWSAAVQAFGDMGDAATDASSRRAQGVASFAAADEKPTKGKRPSPYVAIDGGPSAQALGLALLGRKSAEASPPNLPEAKRLFELSLAQRFDPATAARLEALSRANLPATPVPKTPCTEGFATVELLCRCLVRESTPTECGNSPPSSCNYESNQVEDGALFAIRAGRDDRAERGIAHFVASHSGGTFRAVRFLGQEQRELYLQTSSDIEVGSLEERKVGDRSVWLVHWRERFVARWLVERERETTEHVTFCFPPTAGAPARCPAQLVVGTAFAREPVRIDDPPLDPARAARLAKVLETVAPRSAKVSFELREDGVHPRLVEGALTDLPRGTTDVQPW